MAQSSPLIDANPAVQSKPDCYHCGDVCPNPPIRFEEKKFCCHGCKTVYGILQANGLQSYYQERGEHFLVKPSSSQATRFDYLDIPSIQEKLFSYRDETFASLQFLIPSIRCASCIWLLEQLDQIHAGIGKSQVNFLEKSVQIHFDPAAISLKELVILLDQLGYQPDLSPETGSSNTKGKNIERTLLLQLGLAGFVAGNIMLLSFPEYLGMEDRQDSVFTAFFRYINLFLSIPLLLYSSQPFFKSAFSALRKGFFNIDLPVSIGIIALFSRSSYEILFATGTGYFDSLAGLVFLLLLGKWIQQKTYAHLSFDRDYKSYFPLTVHRIQADGTEVVLLESLEPGDEVRLSPGEIVPADAELKSQHARFDYSFVTGESRLLSKAQGEHLYAGGRVQGKEIDIRLLKSVSQSYLIHLWNAQEKGLASFEQSYTDR